MLGAPLQWVRRLIGPPSWAINHCRRRECTYFIESLRRKQDKPVTFPAKGRNAVRWIDGGAGMGIARKRTLPCNRADRGCVASMGQDYLTGNGADFAMVFKLENICGTDVGSKANDGGASRRCSFPHDGGFSPLPCELAADRYREGFIE
jgi:hypothetical protein